jgi:hypothetical protein
MTGEVMVEALPCYPHQSQPKRQRQISISSWKVCISTTPSCW